MNHNHSAWQKSFCTLAICLVALGPAAAAEYPTKPIRIINLPDVKERFNTLGFTPAADTRAQFAAFIQSEIAKWGKAVKESGAKAD